jgi:hypothetical protein
MALPPLELFSLERKGRLFAGRSFRFYDKKGMNTEGKEDAKVGKGKNTD